MSHGGPERVNPLTYSTLKYRQYLSVLLLCNVRQHQLPVLRFPFHLLAELL